MGGAFSSHGLSAFGEPRELAKPQQNSDKKGSSTKMSATGNRQRLVSARSKKRCLLLGMFFSKGHFELKKPNRGQGFRDAVRCQALEDQGYHVLSLDDKHSEEDVCLTSKKHCQANFADARRMMASLRSRWGDECEFDHIILDYFFSPEGWARTRWADNFFKDTIPRLAEDEVICRGGSIWLPNLQCVQDSVEKNKHILDKYYTVRMVSQPNSNPLFMATETVEDKLLLCPDKLTNDTQMRPLLEHSNTPFLVLKRRPWLPTEGSVDIVPPNPETVGSRRLVAQSPSLGRRSRASVTVVTPSSSHGDDNDDEEEEEEEADSDDQSSSKKSAKKQRRG